jgi:hypothetical protein
LLPSTVAFAETTTLQFFIAREIGPFYGMNMDQPNQITVYQGDVYGFYLHSTVANEFALVPGTYNVPNGALLQPPPEEIPTGQCAFRAGDAWALVEDHRGQDLYRLDTAEKYTLGQTIAVDGAGVCYVGAGVIPDWLTTQQPPAPGSTWTDGAWVAPEPEEEPEAE